MSKRIQLSTRPAEAKEAEGADRWVGLDEPSSPADKRIKPVRLTFDLDPELHRRLRIHCFTLGQPISEFLRNQIQSVVEVDAFHKP
mgnify:CR=1 FL=1|tara:strand:+ start:181324 stop:181581 length:258 start_codon:yes stop_codon:yes gene_type:complete